LLVADRVREEVQERLRLFIDPVQVLEHHDQRLVQGLAQDDPLDRVEGAAAAHLRVSLNERIITFNQADQGEEVAHELRIVGSPDHLINETYETRSHHRDGNANVMRCAAERGLGSGRIGQRPGVWEVELRRAGARSVASQGTMRERQIR
jgi:hypothetical protein